MPLPVPFHLDVLSRGETADRTAHRVFDAVAVDNPQDGEHPVFTLEDHVADFAAQRAAGQLLKFGHFSAS